MDDWHEVYANVTGINHFTWFTEASCHGTDLFPLLSDYIEDHFEEGFLEKDDNWMNSSFRCAHRVKMDLFRRYGWIGAAGDRHLSEFMPGDEYLKDPETVESWKFGLTTVRHRKEDLKRRLARSEHLYRFEEEIPLEPTGEEGILLIKALCGLTRVISNVNIPNHALQIPNLPASAIVETNAVFTRNSIRPAAAGELTGDVRALIMPHIENHDRIYQAALTCDRTLVTEAFMHDPNVLGHHCSKKDITALVDDMIDNTLGFLPEGWKR